MLNCTEAFYGGAAGGGKSIALLMAALQYVDCPGYAAIIFRRTYTDLSLPGALMERAHEWLDGTDAHWSEQSKTWSFPGGGTLTFGYLSTLKDRFRYQSSEFQFIGFDELTQFEEMLYTYLFSRLRRCLDQLDIPLRMRAASNPGNIGHVWAKQRFITEGQEKGRPFIPAALTDNPHLDKEEYVKSLSNLDPLTRAQLLRGDWDAKTDANKFRREWFPIVDAAPISVVRMRYWDLAATEPKPGIDPDYTAGCLMSMSRSRQFCIEDMIRVRRTPGSVEQLILQTAMMDTIGTTIVMEQEPGASGVYTISQFRKLLAHFAFYGVPSTGSKEVRANPVSSQAEAGNVCLLAGRWIGDFLDEAESFPNGEHDDQVDAMSGAYSELTKDRDDLVVYDPLPEVMAGLEI